MKADRRGRATMARLGASTCALAIAGVMSACDGASVFGGGAPPDPAPKPLIPKITSVAIISTPGVLIVGDRVQLVVSVGTVDGALPVVGWASSSPSVASVTNGGFVTALALGVTTITATSLIDTTKSGSITITVGFRAAVNSVTVTPSSATIAVGATEALSAIVSAVGGASTAVTWATSDQSIATVSGSGVVTGIGEGIANITARSAFDPTRTSTIPVTVVARQVDLLRLWQQ